MKKRFITIFSFLLALVFMLAGCNTGGGDPLPVPKPESMRISGMKTEFELGEAFSYDGLQAVVVNDDASEFIADLSQLEVDSSAYDAETPGQYMIVVTLKGTEVTKSYRVTVVGEVDPGEDPGDDPVDPPSGPEIPEDETPVENQINVWIIAGQSNASGYSTVTTVPRDPSMGTDLYQNMLTALDSRNSSGYDVLYYGTCDRSAAMGVPTNVTLRNVKMGLGRNTSSIGPELGMANVLANQSTPSALIKYAGGATFLADIKGEWDVSKNYGTWASPSVTAKYVAQGATPCQYNGYMYTTLLAIIEQAFAALEAKGYVPVIKGYTWFQGEADAGRVDLANAYKANLELFINDLRADVAELVGDERAATRPFVISKICPTGSYGTAVNMETVRAAADMLAGSMDGVYAVETSDLIIGSSHGTDEWHFNPMDMYELGQRIATAALEALAPKA